MSVLIEARGLTAGYGEAKAIHTIDLTVSEGEVVALLGANGAGKTTTLMALAGELRPLAGEVVWGGSAAWQPLHRRARQGLGVVTEERSVFSRLTARQNIAVARDCRPAKVAALFPELEPLMGRRGALLSGGEQQMLALARALAGPTRLLLADELSLGLAPKTVGSLLRAVRAEADAGMGALVVEQHVHRILDIADRVYVLRQGRVEFSGTAAEAQDRMDEIRSHYLTTSSAPAQDR